MDRDDWLWMLGDYPEDFKERLEWVSTDLTSQPTLEKLPEADDTIYFLSVPPERYESANINLKQAGLLDDPETSRVIIEKPLGTIINLLIIYSQWWAGIYAKTSISH